MAQAKYDQIFQALRSRIESGHYGYLDFLPSENAVAREFDTTRNTVRKAIALLVAQGLVQTMQGRGVQVIRRPRPASTFTIGGIESMTEAVSRLGIALSTHMICLETATVDDDLAERSGLAAGARVTVFERLRLLDDVPLIMDRSCFLTEMVPGLSPQIVESSVYRYIEGELGLRVATASREVRVEPATAQDRRLLHLAGMDCVVVVSSTVFDSSGTPFEYTVSRHSPVDFAFQTTAHRLPSP
ncbi:UTRA domain-containing protein [Actinomyces slackii]|uniref:Trehalose operon transcriptional repressor n=1 Tax=Actinomyces slackii TaxID=52774 RepID=A0A448KFE4_9ACTO|nr:UTRA domain-containing protein [Actinomyces slackii]VEG75645.1 Trehalose operon transcriptional repressor [Actinomyces slackii]